MPSTIASTSTDVTTGAAPKPMARNVAISRARLATALYMVFSAATMAPSPIMIARTQPAVVTILRNNSCCSA